MDTDSATLKQADVECNELFRQLDAMKKAKLDSNDNPTYMALLYKLRDATRNRLGAIDARGGSSGV